MHRINTKNDRGGKRRIIIVRSCLLVILILSFVSIGSVIKEKNKPEDLNKQKYSKLNKLNDVELDKNYLSSQSSFEAVEVWNRTWGGIYYEQGMAVWGDGRYVYTIGYTLSFGAGDYDHCLVKWDIYGNKIWNRTWGGNGEDIGYGVWGDEYYLYTVGYTGSYGARLSDLCLIKWNKEGYQVWNRTWGGGHCETGYSVWGSGQFIYTTGFTGSFGAGKTDLFLIKWNNEGSLIWQRTWGSDEGEEGISLWGDHSYIYTTGYIYKNDTTQDVILIKWDINGNQVWNRTWGNDNDDIGYSIWGNKDFIYIAGTTEQINNGINTGITDHFLIKWDKQGNQIWNRTWEGVGANDGDYVWGNDYYVYTSTNMGSYSSNVGAILLIEWDKNGNQNWNCSWDTLNFEKSNAIWGIGNNIYLTGYTYSYGVGLWDLLLIKFRAVVLEPEFPSYIILILIGLLSMVILIVLDRKYHHHNPS